MPFLSVQTLVFNDVNLCFGLAGVLPKVPKSLHVFIEVTLKPTSLFSCSCTHLQLLHSPHLALSFSLDAVVERVALD